MVHFHDAREDGRPLGRHEAAPTGDNPRRARGCGGVAVVEPAVVVDHGGCETRGQRGYLCCTWSTGVKLEKKIGRI